MLNIKNNNLISYSNVKTFIKQLLLHISTEK